MAFDWGNLLLSGLVATVIGAAVSWYSSDRWVAFNQRRREHSLRIADEAIPSLNNKIELYAPLGFRLNNRNEIKYALPKPITDLPYYEDIFQHLKTGYPEILIKWENLKTTTQRHNELLASFLDDKRREFEKFANQNDLNVWYHKRGIDSLLFAIYPYPIVESIYTEFLSRFQGFQPYFHFLQHQNCVDHYLGKYFRLNFIEKELMNDDKMDNINLVKNKVEQICDNEDFYNELYLVYERRVQVLEDRESLIDDLNRVIEIVKLGHNLKGNCDNCISKL